MEEKEQTGGSPEPEGRRARHRQARRAEILDAAMAIVVEEGLPALAIARLARDVGAAVGAIYRYFPSKEALVGALQERAIQAYCADLRKRLGEEEGAGSERRVAEGGAREGQVRGGEGSAEAAHSQAEGRKTAALRRVGVGFGYYLEDADREPMRHRLLDIMLSAPTPVLSEAEARRIDGVLGEVLNTCRGLLDGAVAAGALAPGRNDQRTHVLWALLHGLDHLRKRDRIQSEALRVGALWEAALEAVLRGWGATGKRQDQT